MCLFTGDMNARCGNESDFVAVIDSNYLPKRILIDETKNSRGAVFTDYLKSVNYCIINGRVTTDMDNNVIYEQLCDISNKNMDKKLRFFLLKKSKKSLSHAQTMVK